MVEVAVAKIEPQRRKGRQEKQKIIIEIEI
jgi:hypothetical protein